MRRLSPKTQKNDFKFEEQIPALQFVRVSYFCEFVELL